MGFDGNDFEITVDLGEIKTINALGLDMLLFSESGILLPSAIEFFVSDNGINFNALSTYFPSETGEFRADGPVMLSKAFNNLQSRYVRIKASNPGTCPPALPCAGQKSWLFVSEVEIE